MVLQKYKNKRAYKKKYKKKLAADENLFFFVFKVLTSAALFFLIAVGADIYNLIH